jgi:HPt (histidine-containing phosphotransfer) domain-containing protein
MLEIERIAWMPSPSIVPDGTPIDLDHLDRMTLGDEALAREVLALFVVQTGELLNRLAAWPDDAAALAHRLCGSARGIGAGEVAEAADQLELVLRRGGERELALEALEIAVQSALEAIARRLQ